MSLSVLLEKRIDSEELRLSEEAELHAVQKTLVIDANANRVNLELETEGF